MENIQLGREAKILVLNILRQGYITPQQRIDMENLLGVHRNRLLYADAREVVEEMDKLQKKYDMAMIDLECDKHTMDELTSPDIVRARNEILSYERNNE